MQDSVAKTQKYGKDKMITIKQIVHSQILSNQPHNSNQQNNQKSKKYLHENKSSKEQSRRYIKQSIHNELRTNRYSMFNPQNSNSTNINDVKFNALLKLNKSIIAELPKSQSILNSSVSLKDKEIKFEKVTINHKIMLNNSTNQIIKNSKKYLDKINRQSQLKEQINDNVFTNYSQISSRSVIFEKLLTQKKNKQYTSRVRFPTEGLNQTQAELLRKVSNQKIMALLSDKPFNKKAPFKNQKNLIKFPKKLHKLIQRKNFTQIDIQKLFKLTNNGQALIRQNNQNILPLNLNRINQRHKVGKDINKKPRRRTKSESDEWNNEQFLSAKLLNPLVFRNVPLKLQENDEQKKCSSIDNKEQKCIQLLNLQKSAYQKLLKIKYKGYKKVELKPKSSKSQIQLQFLLQMQNLQKKLKPKSNLNQTDEKRFSYLKKKQQLRLMQSMQGQAEGQMRKVYTKSRARKRNEMGMKEVSGWQIEHTQTHQNWNL